MEQGTIFGVSVRDVSLAIIGLLFTAMGWIFRKQDSRITKLEECKVDATVHESKFAEVVRRLDAQDASAVRRDEKLDRILEKLITP